jgi:hypothetical protein
VIQKFGVTGVDAGSCLPVHGNPLAYWWYVCGCRVPAGAGRRRPVASNF